MFAFVMEAFSVNLASMRGLVEIVEYWGTDGKIVQQVVCTSKKGKYVFHNTGNFRKFS
jgi:hypothetical protein